MQTHTKQSPGVDLVGLPGPIKKMEQQHSYTGLPLLFVSWFLNVLAFMDKSTITWLVGIIATLLAIVNQIILIRKNSKKDPK
jgi:hypothetical protein